MLNKLLNIKFISEQREQVCHDSVSAIELENVRLFRAVLIRSPLS